MDTKLRWDYHRGKIDAWDVLGLQSVLRAAADDAFVTLMLRWSTDAIQSIRHKGCCQLCLMAR